KGLGDISDILSMETEAEFIPLISKEEEENMQKTLIPEELPILPIRNNVLFPGAVLPITLARDKSINLIMDAYKAKKPIGVFSQKNQNTEEPGQKDIHTVGTMAVIVKTLRMPDGSTTVIIQGKRRIKITEYTQEEPYLKAKVSNYDDVPTKSKKQVLIAPLMDAVKDLFGKMQKLSNQISNESLFAVNNIDSPDFLLYFIVSVLEISPFDKQNVLEKKSLHERAYLVLGFLTKNQQVLELRSQIKNKVQVDLDKQQREYLLHQQMKTIQEELGSSGEEEIQELIHKGESKKWSTEVKKVFDKEIAKLQRINSMSPDYSIQLNYLNTFVDLPWGEYTVDKYDLKRARKVLDRDHFGLEKVKERVLSYLAVLKLRGDMKSPILCLYGPPGVGKTSLGKSIAEAMGRKYIRMSLGGLHDEAEIRGHRKTYVGAMPGRIIQSLLKVKSSNPVFVLDEVDKVLGRSIGGDPAAAMLELLDPEQNTAFHDNFLEIDYDLSRVLFIATANSLNEIHPALKDRMEIVEVPGYLEEEKLQIAKKHLVPKQLKEHGLKKKDLSFSDDVIKYIVSNYTRESGVRQLEKRLAGVIRYRANEIVEKQEETQEEKQSKPTLSFLHRIDKEYVKKALGIETYSHSERLKENMAGVVTGLAWTSAGGEILFIEAALSQGKGTISLTGNLGEVMKESATLALEYIKANATKLHISSECIEKSNVHIHVPEGATPKDGPSAGMAIFTAIVSAFTKQKVRADTAMTGEITLRGQTMPIGGVREKILAAKRARIERIVLCKENIPQIEEIPEVYTSGLQFFFVDQMEEILPLIFDSQK
ncbi:MAG: endopeptidase La, partial [Bacteroidales bacterium]